MKMKLLLAVVASMSLAGCATPSAPNITVVSTPVAPPSGNTAISAAAQKALWAAEAAYNVPADAYLRLNRRGALPPALKAQVKPILLQAFNGLRLARQAAAAGDTVGVMLQVGETQRLAAAARALLPPVR